MGKNKKMEPSCLTGCDRISFLRETNNPNHMVFYCLWPQRKEEEVTASTVKSILVKQCQGECYAVHPLSRCLFKVNTDEKFQCSLGCYGRLFPQASLPTANWGINNPTCLCFSVFYFGIVPWQSNLSGRSLSWRHRWVGSVHRAVSRRSGAARRYFDASVQNVA